MPATAQKKIKENNFKLGRVKALGPKNAAEVPFLLPKNWTMIEHPFVRFDQIERGGRDSITIQGTLANLPSRGLGQPPRLSFSLQDAKGIQISCTIFGHTQDIQRQLKSGDIFTVIGRPSFYKNQLQLVNIELIDSDWCGKLRPKYPGKTGYLNAETVRKKMQDWLIECIPLSQDYFYQALALTDKKAAVLLAKIDAPCVTIQALFWMAHRPNNVSQGLAAREALLKLSALTRLTLAKGKEAAKIKPITTVSIDSLQNRLNNLPFTLSTDQLNATTEIIHDMGIKNPMKRLLVGDVGCGKTAVYSMAATLVSDAGGHVAVILPSTTLAVQIYEDFTNWFKDIDTVLVMGGEKVDLKRSTYNLPGTIHIGTTALLHNNNTLYSLIVIDEQHKFGSLSEMSWLQQVHTAWKSLPLSYPDPAHSQNLIS